MMNERKFDNAFREKLDGFSAPPPPHVWNGIQGQMAARQRKKRIIYFSWVAAAAVVVLAFIAGWYFNGQLEKDQIVTAKQDIVEKKNVEKEIEKDLFAQKNIQTEKDKSVTDTPKNSTTPHKNWVVASNYETKTIETEKGGKVAEERFSLRMLARIEAFFSLEQNELFLAEKDDDEPESALSAIDKNLIASNARKLKRSNKEGAGWKMGVNLSPGYSSHVASHTQQYERNMNYSAESGNGNVGAGFSVQYKTGNRWSVESGVYYAQNGQKSGNSYELFAFMDRQEVAYSATEKSYFANAVDVSNGNMMMNSTAGIIEMNGTPKGAEISAEFDASYAGVSNTLMSTGEFSQVFDFIEIPLYLRYCLLDSKFDIELLGGINAGLVVGNNAFIDNEFGLQNIGKTQDISTLNLSGTIGFGVNYGIGKGFSLAVEPRLNYYLNSLNTNHDVDFRPYRIGVYTGLYYEF